MTKIILVVDVDPELSNPAHPSGLSERGLIELQDGLTQVGTIVGRPERWLEHPPESRFNLAPKRPTTAAASGGPVPSAPTSPPPVTPAQSHTVTRRRLALEHATHVAKISVATLADPAAIGDGVVTIAAKIEQFLKDGA